MNKNVLIEFVRIQSGKRKGEARGVVVSTARNCVGWSFTNFGAGDRFDKTIGINIAVGRATVTPVSLPSSKIPQLVRPVIQKMFDRSARYFKENKA